MREITTGKKISDIKKWNQVKNQIQLFMLGAFVMGTIILGFYVHPRYNAYVNAVRVAHTHPEAVESLKVDEIQKKGTFSISMSK